MPIEERDGAFGRNLRVARESKALTRPQLAGLIHVDKSEIGRWEDEEVRPRPANLQKLCEALSVRTFDLPADVFDSENGHSHARNLSRVEKLPIYTDEFNDRILSLARNAKVVHYTSLCKSVSHSGRHRPIELADEEFSSKLRGGGVLFQRVQAFFDKSDLLNALIDARRFSGRNYHCRYFPTPPLSIPAINMSSYDDRSFVIGGYYESRSANADEFALLFDGRETLADFFREYWKVLWAQSNAFPAPTHWRADQQLPDNFGLSGDDWLSIVTAAETSDTK